MIRNLTVFFKQYLFVLSFLFISSIFAKDYNEVQVCSEAGFFPFEMRTVSGEWKGYEIALVNKFAEDTGRKNKLVDIKFDGLIPALIANKGCDMVVSAVSINAEREKIVLFSEITYQSAFAGIVRAGDLKKYNSFEMINKNGVKIAVEQGTEAAQYVKNNFLKAIVLMYEDNSVPINAILTKKADIYIDDNVYTTIAVKRKISHLAMIPPSVFPANEYSGMGFVFRKNDSNFRDEFNRFFAKIKKNGELNKLQKYYFENMGWLKDFPESK